MAGKSKDYYHKQGPWTAAEDAYVRAQLGRTPLSEMARHLERSEMAVRLYCHRRKLTPGGRLVKRNLLVALLHQRFRNLEDFQPSRAFYDYTRISQKRYWNLFAGREQITGDEYRRIADYFGISGGEAMMPRQLDLFEDEE